MLGLLFCSSAYAETSIVFRSDTMGYSGPVSITQYLSDWEGEFRADGDFIAHSRHEIGIKYSGWELGYHESASALFELSTATARFVHRTQNELPLTPGKRYPISVNASMHWIHGPYARYSLPMQYATCRFGMSALKGRNITQGRLRGEAIANSTKEYDFTFDVEYTYNKDRLFSRNSEQFSGTGFAGDIGCDWQAYSFLSAGFQAHNLGYMYWDNATYTTAKGNSNGRRNVNGFTVFDPVVSGFEGNRDQTQALIAYGGTRVSWHWHNAQLNWQTQSTRGWLDHGVTSDFHFSPSLTVQAGWWLKQEQLAVGIRAGSRQRFTVNLALDKVDINDVHALNLSVGFESPLF